MFLENVITNVVASDSMEAVVAKLTTGVTADSIFGVIADLMPFVITMIPIALGLYFLRRLVSGAGKAKVKF